MISIGRLKRRTNMFARRAQSQAEMNNKYFDVFETLLKRFSNVPKRFHPLSVTFQSGQLQRFSNVS